MFIRNTVVYYEQQSVSFNRMQLACQEFIKIRIMDTVYRSGKLIIKHYCIHNYKEFTILTINTTNLVFFLKFYMYFNFL